MAIVTKISQLEPGFKQLHQSHSLAPVPTAAMRIERLERLADALLANQSALQSALCKDFGHRSEFDTLVADIMGSIEQIRYCQRKLSQWMKPQRRFAGWLLFPSRVQVDLRPLGVVGIIVPWNFPVSLSLAPLAAAIAAGNKVMLKLSELTPACNQVLARICQVLDDDIVVVDGPEDLARAFTALPLHHLLFTGSTLVGRKVAQVCAHNLTPVTLELGGKSPVVITKEVDLSRAVDAIIFGKSLNAGQICIAPDYVLLPRELQTRFIEIYLERFVKAYPANRFSQDYTRIIHPRHWQRLQALLDDASALGAQVIIPEGYPVDPQQRLMPPHLLTNVSEEMQISQEEIFGPLLPIIAYDDLEQAIEYVQGRPNPLALYIMSRNRAQQQQLLTHIPSGGVCINDTLLHQSTPSAPFGGIGESGIGHYHGREGFETFSHKRTRLTTPHWLPRASLMMRYRHFFLSQIQRWFIR